MIPVGEPSEICVIWTERLSKDRVRLHLQDGTQVHIALPHSVSVTMPPPDFKPHVPCPSKAARDAKRESALALIAAMTAPKTAEVARQFEISETTARKWIKLAASPHTQAA